ncbi:MAG: hypothetical protein K0S56_1547 [Microvirga sp.]|jgi:hypothetical protein|nr:hypothetical protein [Microvirga sp.]
MAKISPPSAYQVPPLTSVPAYAALAAKRTELQELQTASRRELRKLERELTETPMPALRAGVAALLGEATVEPTGVHERIAELRRTERDAAAALSVIEQRLREARSSASRVVCGEVRPEYARRVAALCRALEVLAAERRAYDELRDQLEAEDIAWSTLTPMSLGWLGNPVDGGHIAVFLKNAQEAGYYGN